MSKTPVILLVDDFEDALEIYGEYLRFHGLRVDTATNGEEAIARATTSPPDLILLDLRMPVLDGATTLRMLRANPRLDKIPIVALTAHALASERDAAIGAGFDAVIAKPCLPDDLLGRVRRILADRQPAS